MVSSLEQTVLFSSAQFILPDEATAITDLSTFHSVEAQDIIQNLFHHRKTANQAIDHLSLILLNMFKDIFALKILDGQKGSIERNADFMED